MMNYKQRRELRVALMSNMISASFSGMRTALERPDEVQERLYEGREALMNDLIRKFMPDVNRVLDQFDALEIVRRIGDHAMTPRKRNAVQERLLDHLVAAMMDGMRIAITNPVGIHELLKSDDSEVLSRFGEALSPHANELLDQLQALGVMR